ncbi:MAG: hypothetical protein ACE5FU_07885 [Nitrospinota bacterium]
MKKFFLFFILLVSFSGCSGTEFPNPGPPDISSSTGDSTSESPPPPDEPVSADTTGEGAGDTTKKRELLRGVPLFAYLFNPCFDLFPPEKGLDSGEIQFSGEAGNANDRVRVSRVEGQGKEVEISYGVNRVTASYDDNDELKSVVTDSGDTLPSISVQCVSEMTVQSELNDDIGKEYVFYSTPDEQGPIEFTVTFFIDENKKGLGQVREFTVSVKDVNDTEKDAEVYKFMIIDSS